jgi:hypothetical protein
MRSRLFLAISTNQGDPTPFLAAEAERTQQPTQQGVLGTMLVKAGDQAVSELRRTVVISRAALMTCASAQSG